MINKILAIAILASCFLFTSCKSKQKMKDGDTTNSEVIMDNAWKDKAEALITNKMWKLTEIDGKQVTYSNLNDKEAYIRFDRSDNQLTGDGGCNTFTGTYTLMKGNKIDFSPIAVTKKACQDMTREQELLNVLEIADNYSISESSLSLHSGRLTSLAKFKAVPQN